MGGAFIALEGPEGAGKSVHLSRLHEELDRMGHEHVVTREPGGTGIGDAIRDILLDRASTGMSPVTELLLYAAARAEHVQKVIMPALRSGRIVLCDRFTDSTLAYQGYGRGLDLELIGYLNDLATSRLYPDLTLLLDIDPAAGLERVRRFRNGGAAAADRLESEDLDFHRKVREGFLRLALEDPRRYRIIDASGSLEDVAGEVVAVVTAFIREAEWKS